MNDHDHGQYSTVEPKENPTFTVKEKKGIKWSLLYIVDTRCDAHARDEVTK